MTQLSEAQHKERQDAARARWAAAKAGAVAAGAAAGAYGARAAVLRSGWRVIDARAQQAVAGAQPRIEAAADRLAAYSVARRKAVADLALLARQNAIGGAFTRQAETEKPGTTLSPVTQRIRLIRRTLLANGPAREQIRARLAAHENDWSLSGREERDLRMQLAHLDSRVEPLEMERDHLLQAQPKTRKLRAGSTKTRRTAEWTVTRKSKAKDTAFERAKPVTITMHGKVGQQYETGEHRATTKPSDISAKGMQRIRDSLREHAGKVHLRVRAHAATMKPTIAARMAPDVAERFARTVARRLGGRLRLAALVGGAVAGGFAAYGAAVGAHRLTKSTPYLVKSTPDDQLDAADHLDAAASHAEPTLAEALARIFRGWKDDATAKLLTPREGSLYSTMLTDLDSAMRPLDPVLRAGVATPIPTTVQGDDGRNRNIIVTMQARGPEMERFVADYRQDRIVQLANAQREAIRNLLLDAARTGASPDEMARQIRQTIGLTSNQAAQVLNYRRQLEALSPGALQRALRDKRFDATITRAIDSKTPLPPEQIAKMVDAYHRRFLAFRAMTIARTEGVGAANNAHVASVRVVLAANPGYTVVKTWNAKLDERTRHDHFGLHDKSVIGLETPFVCDSGKTIRWPHDPEADADEVIRCRCFPSLRIVPRDLAARMGTESVQPFSALRPVQESENVD